VRRDLLAVVALAGTLGAAWVAAPRLAALSAGATLVPADDPTVLRDREVTETFGFGNPVLWVLEARDGSVWTRPMLERLAGLTDEVRRIPGVIAPDVIGLASPNMRDLRVTEDGIEPVYLMGEVPATEEALAALRRRVDGDPSYAGTLVTRDGRAAMAVANFRRDADARAVGTAALALRDRYRDADTAVWVVGAPVLAVVGPAALTGLAVSGALWALAGLGGFTLALGARAALSALLAALLAAVWLATGTAAVGGTLPWALEAVVSTALLAAAAGAGLERPGLVGAVLAASVLPGALVAGPPARALWVATAAGALVAAAAGALARAALRPARRPLAGVPALRLVAAVLAAAALLGAPRLRCSLALVGYGERYLPPPAAADLTAVRRLFPPPLSLAVRARGEPGFVSTPEALRALDAAAAAARADPSVSSAMSIADVVKMVHRAFNDERPEFFAIPNDRLLAGRYLALAYSPALRRFLDRGFADTALWVTVESERPADLDRVLSRLRGALADGGVPGATVELPAGDGAVVLVMARVARQVAGSAALAVLLAVGATAVSAGRAAALRALAAGLAAALVGGGVLGWAGHALDLVSLPLLAGVVVASVALGGAGGPLARLGLGLAGAAAVALAAPLPAAPLVAALLLAPGLALLLVAEPAGGAPAGRSLTPE
jgi:predicted RND superfamily exporter protein